VKLGKKSTNLLKGNEIFEYLCSNLIKNKNTQYIIFHGRPGVGKTIALLAYFASKKSDKIENIYNYIFLDYCGYREEWPSNKLQEFGEALKKTNKNKTIFIGVDGLDTACYRYSKNRSENYNDVIKEWLQRFYEELSELETNDLVIVFTIEDYIFINEFDRLSHK